jgi:hypothetical protein
MTLLNKNQIHRPTKKTFKSRMAAFINQPYSSIITAPQTNHKHNCNNVPPTRLFSQDFYFNFHAIFKDAAHAKDA